MRLQQSFAGLFVWSLFCCAVLSVISRSAIIPLRKSYIMAPKGERELVDLPIFSSWCHMAVSAPCADPERFVRGGPT